MRLLCAAQSYHNAAFAGPPPKQPRPANDHAKISPARWPVGQWRVEIKAVMFNRSNSKRIIRPIELCCLRGIKGH